MARLTPRDEHPVIAGADKANRRLRERWRLRSPSGAVVVSLRRLNPRERLRVTAPSMLTTGNMACGFSAILLAFDIEIITWLDDCTRYALHISAHRAITTPIVLATFRKAAGQHGIPASTLTDNGMVFTTRLAGAGRQGGRNAFEVQLRTWNVVQKNSRPSHPTTCGKVERFQQTLKKWLRKQIQPATIDQLQALIDAFVDEYNHRRGHKSLPHRATPATLYNSMPKALPGPARRTSHR